MPESRPLNVDRLLRLSTKRAQQEFYDSGFVLPGSFGLRVSRNGRKVFFLLFRDGKKRRRATLGTYPLVSLDEARERAQKLLRAVEDGAPLPFRRGRRVLGDTFGEVAKVFMDQHVREHCSKKTATEYQRLLEREILPFLADRPLDGISAAELGAMIDDIWRERSKPVLAQRVRALLSRIYSFAIKRGQVQKNPLFRMAAPISGTSQRPVFSTPDIARIFSVLETESSTIRAVVTLAFFLGTPVTQLLGLSWRDIRPEYLLLKKNSTQIRELFLVSEVRAIFRQLANDSPPGDYVFQQGTGHVTDLRRKLRSVGRRAGLNDGVSALDIRRTVESGLYQLRVRPDVIDYILGRNSLAVKRNTTGGFDFRQEAKVALSKWAATLRSSLPRGPKSAELKLIR